MYVENLLKIKKEHYSNLYASFAPENTKWKQWHVPFVKNLTIFMLALPKALLNLLLYPFSLSCAYLYSPH